MEVKQDTTRQCLSCAFHITQMRKRQRSASRIAEIGVEGAASQRGADLVKNGRETLEVRAHLLPGVRLFPACATDIGLLPGYQCARHKSEAAGIKIKISTERQLREEELHRRRT